MAATSRDIRFIPGAGPSEVSAILDRPDECRALFVLGHGSGSNMRVPFIAGLSAALVDAGIATFRYEYPYSESADFVPYSDVEMDEQEILLATVRSAVATAAAEAPDLAVFAGGHSVSGLMTSMTDAVSPMPSLAGLVILGFPLKGDFERAAHLSDASHPMLFLQGTDDTLGDADEIERMVGTIETDTSVHFVESADHGFIVPDRSDEDVYAELARTIADWTAALV
jgi:predicted alpha/beta-hydrolase family hydrolase